MPRPQRCRRVCREPEYLSFRPEEGTESGEVQLNIDEYEVLRLVDYEHMTHAQCAERMDISRTTVTEIYASARRKLAQAIVDGRGLVIDGGSVRLCDHTSPCGYGCCTPDEAEGSAVTEPSDTQRRANDYAGTEKHTL